MNDLISRQAAIRWVKTECNPYGKPTLDFESGKKVIEHLKQMPSAQTERKTGRWIDMDDHALCSLCGATHYGVDKNYCPNCGAYMRGEDEEG